MRNCTRDEGRPFEVGNQVLISSHRKLLSSKAMVVNVAERRCWVCGSAIMPSAVIWTGDCGRVTTKYEFLRSVADAETRLD
jgi:hypothetical protein